MSSIGQVIPGKTRVVTDRGPGLVVSILKETRGHGLLGRHAGAGQIVIQLDGHAGRCVRPYHELELESPTERSSDGAADR